MEKSKTQEFKARKTLLRYMKDGKPIKTDHRSIHNHKIAALIFLVMDNGDEFPEIVSKCEEVANKIYDNVEAISKNVYLQDLENKIESKVAKNIYLQMFLLSVSLIQGNSTSPIAIELITMINSVVDKNRERYSHINVDNKLKRLHRIVKKNYKPIN